MIDIQPYQFEPEETSQDEDDSAKERARRTGNTNWCLCELLALVMSEHLTFPFPL